MTEMNAAQHVAIIMDGNGRWAKQRGKMRPMGHRAGVKSVRKIVEACEPMGIKCLTLFAFSSENWQRPPAEVKVITSLFRSTLEKELAELHAQKVRIRFLGDLSAFSKGLQRACTNAELTTFDNTGLQLNLAVNYGGRWDIANAASKIAADVAAGKFAAQDVDQHLFEQYLTTSELPFLDLLIRTGCEKRISNFLLWQMAYSELYFVDTLWPDFDADNLRAAVAWFNQRQRRFGKTDEQVMAETNNA